jgi:superfamily II RNA helicase
MLYYTSLEMVRLCNGNNYNKENNEVYAEHFNKFSFPLSDFQKHAIEGIVEGHHSLVCCPTGSGKTLPAEFAIEYFTSKNKRVIYTSPLKALSNEKFYSFTQKYPNISFGVLTGDIKLNPDAQVLIMTAEILLNTLFAKKHGDVKEETLSMSLSFDMDFDNELACVIMDEIHFINDSARGKVWEETLMLLPQHIQLIMLSATLDSPEKFAGWIEGRGGYAAPKKQVYLSTSNHRIVPLTHYSFITTNQGLFKQIKRDEELTKQVKDMINKPLIIQSARGEFNEIQYHKIKKTLDLLNDKQVYVKRQHVINEVCKYMFSNNLLPAVLFILSRKQIDVVSKEITAVLLEDDSKVPYTIKKECDDILRKLPNGEEYRNLPEYINMVSLLEKGIGIHHSGVIPILREITEILFSKGYVKLLLATETFSVGLNMPIKTTVFTSLSKFDGTENRYFHSHEYMQCSGRAGRRGIDAVGTVIHLVNLFRTLPLLQEYKLIMNGKPQTLVSKFKLSYNLLLNLVDSGDEETVIEFIKKSMIHLSLQKELDGIQLEITQCENKKRNLESVIVGLKTPIEVIDKYIMKRNSLNLVTVKKRKEIDRELETIRTEWFDIEKDLPFVIKRREIEEDLDKLNEEYYSTDNYLNFRLHNMLDFLLADGFIEKNESQWWKLSVKGFIAAQLKELHCLVFANIWTELAKMDSYSLIKIFSCFTNVVVADEVKTLNYGSILIREVAEIFDNIKLHYEKYQDFETNNRIETGVEYNIQYDLLGYMEDWSNASNVVECMAVLSRIEKDKGIFLGEFVKAVLKINAISAEMEKIAESIGNVEFLHNLRKIPNLTLKYVATTQSLYL